MASTTVSHVPVTDADRKKRKRAAVIKLGSSVRRSSGSAPPRRPPPGPTTPGSTPRRRRPRSSSRAASTGRWTGTGPTATASRSERSRRGLRRPGAGETRRTTRSTSGTAARRTSATVARWDGGTSGAVCSTPSAGNAGDGAPSRIHARRAGRGPGRHRHAEAPSWTERRETVPGHDWHRHRPVHRLRRVLILSWSGRCSAGHRPPVPTVCDPRGWLVRVVRRLGNVVLWLFAVVGLLSVLLWGLRRSATSSRSS